MSETRLEIDDFPIPVGDDESVADRVVWSRNGPKMKEQNVLRGLPGGKWVVRGATEKAMSEYIERAMVDGSTLKQLLGDAVSIARGKGSDGVAVFDETMVVVEVYRV